MWMNKSRQLPFQRNFFFLFIHSFVVYDFRDFRSTRFISWFQLHQSQMAYKFGQIVQNSGQLFRNTYDSFGLSAFSAMKRLLKSFSFYLQWAYNEICSPNGWKTASSYIRTWFKQKKLLCDIFVYDNVVNCVSCLVDPWHNKWKRNR